MLNQKNEVKLREKFFSLKKNSLFKKNDVFNLQLNFSQYHIIIAFTILLSSFFIFDSIVAEAQPNSSSSSMINSTQAETLYKTGIDLYDQQKYDEALQFFDKALAINPSYVNALNSKGLALDHLQRYDEAIQFFDKALAINPSSVNALNNKAFTLDHLQRYDEALQSFDKAISLDPSNTKALEGKDSISSKLKQDGQEG